MKNKIKESKAQIEVWEWKDKAAKDVENLDIKSAIRKRLEDSVKNSKVTIVRQASYRE